MEENGKIEEICMLSKFSFLLFILFLISVYTFAQENSSQKEESVYSENAESNEIRQPFAWESAGDVLKYEIIIQRLDTKSGEAEDVYFHETSDEERKACLVYIEPILPPGKYRSQIKVYNILGILEESLTSYDEFTIRRAYRPTVNNVVYPLYLRSAIYLDDLDNNGVIEIEGKNLFEVDTTKSELSFTDYFLKSDRKKIYPSKILEHSTNNKKVTFKFDMKKLDVGKYHFFAQDASGLHSEENLSNSFTIKFRKWADLDIEAGYVFPIILHDNTFQEYLDTNIFPLSGQARLSFMPFKHNWGYLGLGIRATYSRINSEFDTYSIDGNLGMAHLLFVYQLPTFRRRLFFELHGGAGLTYFNNILFHFSHDIDSEELNTLCLSFDVGLAVQYYMNKRFYLEAGADYNLTINSDMNLGMLMPSLGVGWQF